MHKTKSRKALSFYKALITKTSRIVFNPVIQYLTDKPSQPLKTMKYYKLGMPGQLFKN